VLYLVQTLLVLFETAILGTKITCVRFGTEFTGIAIMKLLICVQK
jgi:hypothetical protein